MTLSQRVTAEPTQKLGGWTTRARGRTFSAMSLDSLQITASMNLHNRQSLGESRRSYVPGVIGVDMSGPGELLLSEAARYDFLLSLVRSIRKTRTDNSTRNADTARLLRSAAELVDRQGEDGERLLDQMLPELERLLLGRLFQEPLPE
jgi:hypothetical protein